MRCAKAQKMISDDLDGLLAPEKKAVLDAHLESCPACRDLRSDFAAIVEQAGRLPVLEPSSSAWADISARLCRAERERPAPAGERRFRTSVLQPAGWRYALAAVLALVVIGGGVVVGWKWRSGISRPDKGSLEYTIGKLQEAQDYYEKAVSALTEAVQTRKEEMDPRLAEAFQQNLDSIDATIQACQRIVRSDPDNLSARNYLLAAYRDKVNFLEEVMGLRTAYAGSETGVTL